MMIRWLSRYHWQYPRSLVYMLQATEYRVRDFLRWYYRVPDFRRVERRKRLVPTRKALLLLAVAWTLLLAVYGGAAFRLISGPVSTVWSVAAAAVLVVAPEVVAYGLVVFLTLATVAVQRPLTSIIVRRAAAQLQTHPATRIAVAGSYGKTSMREILKTVLASGRRVAAPAQSVNTPLGISRFVQTLRGDEEVLIFELGEEYPGDVRRLCRLVDPQLGVITGVNEAHLERFGSLEQTGRTVFELADWLGERPLYVNGEDETVRRFAPAHAVRYDRQGAGDWRVEEPRASLEGTNCAFVRGETRLDIRSRLLGLHHLGPLAAAADIATRLSLTPEQIQRGLGETKPFDHRLEPKTDAGGVITLDDSYNGNPDGVRVVIDFLASLRGHRRFYVTPGLVEMGSRAEAVHERIGTWLAQAGIEHVLLVRNSVTPFIERGLRQAGYRGQVAWFDDGPAAFAALPHLTVRGDVVLLQNDWPDQYQ